jgi:hypothetical protein
MRKEGERLIIEPAKPESLLAVLATLEPLDEELPPVPELDLDPVDLGCALRSVAGGSLLRSPKLPHENSLR